MSLVQHLYPEPERQTCDDLAVLKLLIAILDSLLDSGYIVSGAIVDV